MLNRFVTRRNALHFISFLVLSIYIFIASTPQIAYAISREQKRLYNLGINYYDLAACGALGEAERDGPADPTIGGSSEELAKQILASDEITYWTNNGVNTRDVVEKIAKGERPIPNAANADKKEVDMNPNVLKFILDASKKGRVMVNALTDKTHSDGSNHYKGLAVDLDNNPGNTSVSVAELDKIAKKYGGERNSETSHHHYDFLDRSVGQAVGGPEDLIDAQIAAEGDPATGSTGIYMVGDSITLGAKNKLEEALKSNDNQSTVYINGSESRAIKIAGTTQGNKTSGLEAIEEDAETRIANTEARKIDKIIVALGTNPEDNFEQSMKEMIENLRKINKDATIYWVNVFSPDRKGRDKINKSIDKVANANNVTVIDLVDKKISTSDGIHPDADGKTKLADSIASRVTEGSAEPATPEGGTISCECGGSSGSEEFDASGAVRGEKAAREIWKQFIGWKGLKAYQVAGILGNIQVESGFNPRALEPSTTGDAPVSGRGYGLVQWTDRHANLLRRAKEKDVKVYDLNFQINHIKWELENPESAAWAAFKETKNITEAWQTFSTKFERPAVPLNPARGAAAADAMKKFSSEVASDTEGSPDTTSCTKSDGSTGEVSGEYSLPIARKFYDSHKEWFTDTHHDHPASDIPVPVGTSVYSMTAGKVIMAPVNGDCGQGIIIDTSEGVRYTYCHGTDGGSIQGAKTGDTVKPGQLIMHSGNTGRSKGAHLHVQIAVERQLRCPQKMFTSIAEGNPVKEKSLASSGCTYDSGGRL